MKKTFGFLVLFMGLNFSQAQTIQTIGPMMHVNFGGEKTNVSWGVEWAYWSFAGFPYSVDAGLEFAKKRMRIYSEGQTGIGLLGIAIGPVLEFQTDNKKVVLGLQTNLWANYYLGGNFRVRFIDKNTFFCPGVYVKGGFGGRDKDGKPIKVSESNSSWGDD